MSHSVEDGALLLASPSSIDKFDDSTRYGCNRKWWYNYVAGIKEPESPKALEGTAVHKRFETWREDPQLSAIIGRDARLLEILNDPTGQHEQPVSALIDGVTVRGRLDYRTANVVLDLKTTGNVEKNALTKGQLKTATQMVFYPYAAGMRGGSVAHCYLQMPLDARTSPKLVEAKITTEEIDTGITRVKSVLAQMKAVAAERSVENVKPDKSKCFNCFYKSKCQGTEDTMSLFENLMTVPKTEPEPEPEFESVLPPDAPPPDVVVTAPKESPPAPPVSPPAPVPAPVPEAKRGRGRPPKEKVDFEFKEVTVSCGATIPTTAYGNVRIDVSFRAAFSGDPDEAYAKVHAKCKEKVLAEVQNVSASMNKKA